MCCMLGEESESRNEMGNLTMNNQIHNQIVSFIWGIADDCLRDVYVRGNSIAWLAHQLIGLEVNGVTTVDSVIVVTDRVNLDKQIRDTIKQFMQVSNTVAWAESSGDLREAIAGGKKIIITTVHKFPFILNDIGTAVQPIQSYHCLFR